MTNISTLELAWRHRPSSVPRTNRKYLDFVIDGQSLQGILPFQKLDLISCLGWFVVHANNDAVRRLTLELPADLGRNRRSLYVCPECGDLGCGAITAIIEDLDGLIAWHDFGFEYDYEPESLEQFTDVEPIFFAVEEYKRTIMSALQET